LFFLFICNSLFASEPPELATLLARVQVTPPAQVAFTEQRQNRLMKEPLVLSGRLAYPGAGRLEKIVEEPFRETLRVDGDEIAIVRDGSERRVSLRNRKTFRVMLGSIEAIMAGGAATLEEHFEARVSGDDERWRIDLQPRSRRLAGQLEAMAVSGVGDRVESIRFTLPDGEWQLLEIRHEEPVHE
jgi:hypothetical protein